MRKMTMAIVMVVVSMIATTALCSRSTYKISWDSTPTGTSSATATVEVVTNPLLDSESGSHKEVADEIWKHLEDLNADLVRYLAWFPYPRYAVAKDTTGWRTDKVASMLGCFLDATEKKGHKTVLNFAAQPAHLFEPVTVANMSDDPSEPAWSYANGKLPKENKKLVVDYYKTLWRLIKYGWVLDNETGENVTLCNNDGDCVHSGLSHWEFFNDNEHYLTAEEYTELYNGIKDDIVSTLGAENAPKFIVGGGMSPSMATSVLDKINGDADYLSFNYRASPRERANPFTYEELFTEAEWFANRLKKNFIPEIKRKYGDKIKLMINEAATVLPNDMTPTASNPSSIYWAASASSFAYLFSLLTQTGIASVAMGMLSGFSAMPEQSLNTPFYPSMSLTDWDTGAPNARYWVLKLLAEHIKPGMNIHAAQRVSEESTEVFCAASDSRSGYPDLEFSCDDSEATLSIDFASFGTPSGVCGNYSVDPYCHAYSVQQYITRECNEKNACAVKVFPLPWLDPCKGYIETVRAQARCSVGKGRGSPVDSGDTSVLALEGSAGNVKNKTILVVNHRHEATTVSINAGHVLSAKMWVVDSETTTEGPTQITLSSLNNIQLGSFATAIISISN